MPADALLDTLLHSCKVAVACTPRPLAHQPACVCACRGRAALSAALRRPLVTPGRRGSLRRWRSPVPSVALGRARCFAFNWPLWPTPAAADKKPDSGAALRGCVSSSCGSRGRAGLIGRCGGDARVLRAPPEMQSRRLRPPLGRERVKGQSKEKKRRRKEEAKKRSDAENGRPPACVAPSSAIRPPAGCAPRLAGGGGGSGGVRRGESWRAARDALPSALPLRQPRMRTLATPVALTVDAPRRCHPRRRRAARPRRSAGGGTAAGDAPQLAAAVNA